MEPQERQLIHKFPRAEGEEIQFAIRKYRDKLFIDIRLWFKGESQAHFLPTKKGVTLALGQIEELKTAVTKLDRAAAATAP